MKKKINRLNTDREPFLECSKDKEEAKKNQKKSLKEKEEDPGLTHLQTEDRDLEVVGCLSRRKKMI